MKRSFMRCSAQSSLIILLFSVFVLLCGPGVSQKAWARSAGIAGYSGKTGSICTSCHSASGSAPTVTLIGPTSLTPGASGLYTFTITGGAASVGGLDVATSGTGSLQATDPNTQIKSAEVVQKGATSFSGGSLSFTFTLVAPSTPGSLTLYAAGLSANGNQSTSGDNAAGTTLNVTVAASSAPQIVITDSTGSPNDSQISFGSVNDGLTSDQTVTISNAGNADLNITSIASANPLAAPFSIPTASDNCLNTTLAPGGNCSLIVRFAPTSSGTFTDAFDIQSNDSTSPATVNVSGTGMTPPSTAQIVISNLNILFGSVNDGLASDQTVTISNGGNAGLAIYQIAYANPLAAPFTILVDNCSGKTIASGGNCSLTVRFAPTSSGTFSDSFDVPSNDPATPATVSVSGTGNAPPTAPTLVSPADGQTVTGTTATLVWNKSTDPDNDSITYHVYNCPGDSTASCTPVTASNGLAGIYFAGSGFLFVGFVFARGRGRKLMLMLMIAVLLMCGAVFISCGSGSNGSSAPTTVSYQASGLTPGTTYYWKVVADDGHAQTPSTTIWSYSTAP